MDLLCKILWKVKFTMAGVYMGLLQKVSSSAIRNLYLSSIKGRLVRRLLHIMLFDKTKVVIIHNEDNI